MTCKPCDPRRYFLFGARIYFGLWILYAGVVKWIQFGASGFVGFIAESFDKTWSPHALNVVLAWIILIAEPVSGIWLLTGRCQRRAWSLTSLLMFMLMFGQTLLMKPEVTDNWHYVVFALVCAALSDDPHAMTESAAA
jgi:uncharacterized membrane protein YphA (DoxX/SURF4 family)